MVDFTNITQLTSEVSALQQEIAITPEGPAKVLLQAQLNVSNAKLKDAIDHARQQAESTDNFFSNMQWWNILNSAAGNAPGAINSVLAIFQRK